MICSSSGINRGVASSSASKLAVSSANEGRGLSAVSSSPTVSSPIAVDASRLVLDGRTRATAAALSLLNIPGAGAGAAGAGGSAGGATGAVGGLGGFLKRDREAVPLASFFVILPLNGSLFPFFEAISPCVRPKYWLLSQPIECGFLLLELLHLGQSTVFNGVMCMHPSLTFFLSRRAGLHLHEHSGLSPTVPPSNVLCTWRAPFAHPAPGTATSSEVVAWGAGAFAVPPTTRSAIGSPSGAGGGAGKAIERGAAGKRWSAPPRPAVKTFCSSRWLLRAWERPLIDS